MEKHKICNKTKNYLDKLFGEKNKVDGNKTAKMMKMAKKIDKTLLLKN